MFGPGLNLTLELKAFKKKYSPAEARVLIASFCAYRERCHSEVRARLAEYGLFGADAEALLSEMISMGYLDEARFSKAFVRGKFLYNDWGRVKIVQALKSKQVSDACIRIGLEEIEPDAYESKLRKLAHTRSQSGSKENPLVKRQKLMRYLSGKGFESGLIANVLEEMESGRG